ncbi:ribosome recycling factor [Calidifontibacillus erzurumensis]|uniref:Ribosome-recycling factor n=1 Tax=Calidifontibacillus erzurumensis TaxID=2741433 RepID=A0A8J8GEW9_9BACI|nr:ribosome recycling factor [Calidifontibacillus erzurumensis]NSL51153.1 ribosome recycling factor [Calidifontibacillus erzurumensis]
MGQTVIKNAKEKMNKAIQVFKRELATVRAGRANPSLLERVQVNYYGAPTPLNQLASITVPEARLLVVQPYDKSVINDIEKAILKSDLGLNPTNDGSIIRITIPPLTEERRKALAKDVRAMAEDAKVAIRNIRRDANDELKKLEKDGQLTEDEHRSFAENVQKETDNHIKEIDAITKEKEKEIMEV